MTRKAPIAFALLALVAAPTVLAATERPPAPPDRSAPPELGPPPSLELPPLERFELANGLPVYLLAKRQVPIVQIDLVARSGSVADPEGGNGLASMTLDLMDEGAGSRDALALADAIDFLGADLDTFSGLHASGVELSVPVAQLDPALALLADVVRRPTLPPEELERLRAERLTRLLQDRDEPRAIASTLFDRTLYGAGHPYGASPTEASLGAIGRDDLVAFHRRHLTPGNSFLVVVGDVTAAGLRPRLEAAFGDWEGEAPEPATVAAPPQVEGRTVYLVDKPGAAQSEIRIGRIGVARDSPDYFALEVMNTVLGGSFTSRLNSNLREEKGYSYGARSMFLYRPAPGPFLAMSAVQTDVTDKALVEFLKELEAILEIPAEELDRARNYLALRYPRRFQTAAGIAQEIRELVLHDLPADYFNTFVGNVLAVDAADVARVAKRYVVPDSLAVVVVGDREAVGRGVEALALGPVVHLTVEEVLGPAPGAFE